MTDTQLKAAQKDISTNIRQFDLVRFMRGELHEQDLITDEEYAWLCTDAPMAQDPKGGSPSPRRLEDYDNLRQQLADKTQECEELEEKIKSDNKAVLAMVLHCLESGVCLDSPAIIRRMNEIDQLRAENTELKKDNERLDWLADDNNFRDYE